MAYNEQDLLPVEQIKKELLLLCVDGESGDFCLFTEEKHAAVISLHEGDIVGLRYRISRGNDALKLIKGISKAKIRFEKNASSAISTGLKKLPSTKEILHFLEIKSSKEVKPSEVNPSQEIKSSDDSTAKNIRKKILVVEDSRTQRAVICRMLKQNGYDILEAGDGYEALEQVGKENPDMILLDIVMPGMDGYKVMSLIKEKPGMKAVPIIMLTSRDNLIDKMRGKVSGTNEYLTKPFKYEELIAKIDKYLYTDSDDPVLNVHLFKN